MIESGSLLSNGKYIYRLIISKNCYLHCIILQSEHFFQIVCGFNDDHVFNEYTWKIISC